MTLSSPGSIPKLEEPEFRRRVQETLHRVEKAFDEVDPDVAECEQSLGSLTITLADGARCILSTQPSVRQLWLALASRGMAHHFNVVDLDPPPATGPAYRWVDGKNPKVELLSLLESILKEATGLPFQFKS